MLYLIALLYMILNDSTDSSLEYILYPVKKDLQPSLFTGYKKYSEIKDLEFYVILLLTT